MDINKKKDIIAMSLEFDKMDGYVTCETSIHRNDIPDMEVFVKDNIKLKFGNWVAIECDTCVDYHGDGSIHISIETFNTIEKIKKTTNFIKEF